MSIFGRKKEDNPYEAAAEIAALRKALAQCDPRNYLGKCRICEVPDTVGPVACDPRFFNKHKDDCVWYMARMTEQAKVAEKTEATAALEKTK